MIALLFSEAGRMAAALGAMVIPSAHAAAPGDISIVQPDPTVPDMTPFKWEPLPGERRCLRRWGRVYYAAQALDIATTVAAIESGRGAEANPVYKLMFGKKVSSVEVLGFKALSMGATEFMLSRTRRDGDFEGVCRSYKISAGLIGGVALLNIRVFF